jgi:hypothetical protein
MPSPIGWRLLDVRVRGALGARAKARAWARLMREHSQLELGGSMGAHHLPEASQVQPQTDRTANGRQGPGSLTGSLTGSIVGAKRQRTNRDRLPPAMRMCLGNRNEAVHGTTYKRLKAEIYGGLVSRVNLD